MRRPLLLISLSLAAFLSADVLAQNQVQIQFQTDPVLVQTGTETVFTVLTVSQVLSMTWQYQGVTLGLWAGGSPVVNEVAQFQGRVTISATQLRIGGTQLRDAGNYSVEVIPLATTGLEANSRSIRLRVFDAVAGVSVFVPSVAIEGRNISLMCTWTAGTEITVQWDKADAAITDSSRITISGGSLVINPARRSDAGDYTCTVRNPVSASSATQSLTVYYGPDTPVLTKDAPKECVGGGDVLVGQTVRLTCMSDSEPSALFSWQRDGSPVASGQPDSGVLSVQTFTTDESGRYVCTARNAITGDTSEQGTDLAVVDTCLSAGEVAGIVIGCLLLIVIIVLLIVCLLLRARQLRGQRETLVERKTDANPVPPNPEPNGARDLGQGLHPPLYHLNAHTQHPGRLYTSPHERRGNPQTLQLNGLHNSDTHQHNGQTSTNTLLHNAPQITSSYPHNGIDNPAFTHTDARNANTLANGQQQNPNIVIQAGTAQSGAQPPAVHVSLLPPAGQQHNNAQAPAIHVNLNSYPANGQQQAHQDNQLPFSNLVGNNASQTQQTQTDAAPSDPRIRHGRSSNTWTSGDTDGGHRGRPEFIPTGRTHHNGSGAAQRNANTQTYQQEREPHSRSDRSPERPRHQLPWDRLRGTPAYPSRQPSPELFSDTTDYTTHPPLQQATTQIRSQPRPQSQTASRSRAPPGHDAPSEGRRARSRSADPRGSHTLRVPQLEPARLTHSSYTQRERAQHDIRGLPSNQTAPRQEATHSSRPQALPLMSQQASVGRSAVSQGPTIQQGWQGADTRALADPNHLPQTHMAQQHSTAVTQTTPQGLGTQTLPVINAASQPRQAGAAPVPRPSGQPSPSKLTQAALRTHTESAQTFQNRKQQTQAALLHPGPRALAAAAGTQHPPTPPPVIPLTEFQTLPIQRTQHKSPTRGPRPPRPPVNIPVAQRPQRAQQRPDAQHRHATVHTVHTAHPHHHHHHPGHVHVGAHRHAHARGPGHPAHFTHPRQQQAHRGRPR